MRIFLYPFSEGKTVHFRHLSIQQDKGKGTTGAFCDFERLKRSSATFDLGRLHSPTSQHPVENASVGEVIVHNQSMQVTQLFWL